MPEICTTSPLCTTFLRIPYVRENQLKRSYKSGAKWCNWCKVVHHRRRMRKERAVTEQPLFLKQDLQCNPNRADQAKPEKHYIGARLDRLATAALLHAVRDVTNEEDPEAAWAIAWLRKDGRAWLDELEGGIDEDALEDWLEYITAVRVIRIKLTEQIKQSFRKLKESINAKAN